MTNHKYIILHKASLSPLHTELKTAEEVERALNWQERGTASRYEFIVAEIAGGAFRNRDTGAIVKPTQGCLNDKAWKEFHDTLPLRRIVHVTFGNGSKITTDINGTIETVREYYRIGREFNIGNDDDNVQSVKHLEVVW